MTTKIRKILALAICLAAVLIAFPTAASATNHEVSGTWDGFVLATGDTITLTGDVTGDLTIPANVTELTIDGGETGKTINGGIIAEGEIELTLNNVSVNNSSGYAIEFVEGGGLTGMGTVNITARACGIYASNGNIIIDGEVGAITATSEYSYGICASNGNITITGTVGNNHRYR